ncbi:MAG: 2Fe-2S iron-sulfur cluster-binding protein [Actinomycetota bacterium]
MSTHSHPIQLHVNGERAAIDDVGGSLLEALRDQLGIRSPKDGCSPQGQCGCCTVLVDGQPRVSCVTPARRVAGRAVTTVDGLDDADDWADAMCATGGSQCGFCTPGIIVRLSALRAKYGELDEDRVTDALKAHLCRCTGWQTIVEAAVDLPGMDPGRDLAAASQRATLEGRADQRVHPDVALGAGGFADDAAPVGAAVAVRDQGGAWVRAESVTAARQAAGKVQGRRTTRVSEPPIELPAGEWAITLRTSWVEPAYLETDASWAVPGGEPTTPLANGGAFGAKLDTDVVHEARTQADAVGVPVRVLASREDTVRHGPKRPPIAAGLDADGNGVVRVARTAGIADAIRRVAPGLVVEEVDVEGPSTSVAIRGAGWVEAAVLRAAASANATITSPEGAVASASYDGRTIDVEVRCGRVLDEVVLRSYCIGAAHMAYSWVTSEALTVEDGEVLDLTVRSFGIVRAVDMPPVRVSIIEEEAEPVNGSDAAFAAVAAAVWRHHDHGEVWPVLVSGD